MLRNFECELESSCRLDRVNVETLEILLNSVAVQASPLARLKAVLSWINHEKQHRHCYIGRLLSCIPGALLGDDELSSLRNHSLVRNNCNGRSVVDDMQKEHVPYHSTPEGVALGLQFLNNCCERRVFRFVAGCAEFLATVTTGSGACSHLKVTLECKRVAVTKCMNLPSTLGADISMRLCYEDFDGQMKEMNAGKAVEEHDVRLVESGCSKEWVRCIDVDPHERARDSCNDKDFTLYVQVSNLATNEPACSHGNMGCTRQYDRYTDCSERNSCRMMTRSNHHSRHRSSRSHRHSDRYAEKEDLQRVAEMLIEEPGNSKQAHHNCHIQSKVSCSRDQEQAHSRKPLRAMEGQEGMEKQSRHVRFDGTNTFYSDHRTVYR